MGEAAVDEEYKSKAQQRYFHAKAAEGDPEFQKLANEFDKETTKKQFANLPNKAPKKEALNSDKIKDLVKEEILRQLTEDNDND
jgi:predicted glycosyltransferase